MGMVFQNLYDDASKPQASYKDMYVILLDKTLYYAEECEHILRVADEAGYKQVAIIAKDFQGDAPNTFIPNHMQGKFRIVLARLTDDVSFVDLAVYIGGHVVSETAGMRVEDVTAKDFTKVESVMADPAKVLVKTLTESKQLKSRVKSLREEFAKDKNNQSIKSRLASLTNGIVTAKIGGRTPVEIREKIYRYEDAINAVRSAKQWGYLIGGGLSMLNAYNGKDYSSREEKEVALAMTSASINQIAENSTADIDFDQLTDVVGYNAATGKYENLLKAGVVEPFKATEMALKNAISVADIITSIGTYIVIKYDDKEQDA
jgi:chaperonin GroEL